MSEEANEVQELSIPADLSGRSDLSLLAAMPTPALVLHLPSGEIVFSNEAAQHLLGRNADGLRGCTVADVTAPDDAADVARYTAQARHERVDIEKRYLRPDGSTVPARLHAIAFPGAEDYGIATLFELTEYKRCLGRLQVVSDAAALVPGADIGLDAVSDAVAAMATDHFGLDVTIEWFDESFEIVESQSCELKVDGGRLRCPIVLTDTVLGEISVVDDGDEGLRLCIQSLAQCLAGAASVERLGVALGHAELFERGFDCSDVGMQLVDDNDKLLRVNDAFARMVGREPDDVVGRTWMELTHPDDIEPNGATTPRRAATSGGATYRDVKRYLRPDGSLAFGAMIVSSMPGDRRHDQPVRLVQVIDVTEQMASVQQLARIRQDLAASESRYRSLVDPAPDPVLRVAVDGSVLAANESAHDIFEIDTAATGLADLFVPGLAAEITEMVRRVAKSGETERLEREWISRPDGSTAWYSIRGVADSVYGASSAVHVVLRDITQTVEHEYRMARLALTDGLTGIANRAAVYERIEEAFARIDPSDDCCVAVAAINLDHFKTVNDSFGHAFGDEVLRLFARALSNELRQGDTIGRHGGDEFLLVFPDQANEEEALATVERIVEHINPLQLDVDDGRSISLSASVGLAVAKRPEDVDDVVEYADRALLEAKRTGRGRLKVAGWAGRPGAAPSLRVQLRDLFGADERGEFELLYQPIIGRDGFTRSVEALIRWNHPTRGQLAPVHFIDALVDSGHIARVGRWVVSNALRQIDEWDRSGLHDLSLNLNVSPGELAHPGFRKHLRTEIERSSVDPSRIRIEVTELAMTGTFVPTAMLDELASTGAQIVLDDFGTGVSSLSHLRAKSLSGIKVDRSFLTNTAEGAVDRGIVEGIIELAHNIGVDVTVEGVETDMQAEWLASTGCETMQGWLFSKAVSASSIPTLIAKQFTIPGSVRPS